MFRRAITRSTRTGSAKEELSGRSKPFFEADARLEVEQALRLGDVRPRVADVAETLRRIARLDGLAEDRADRLRKRVHARRRRGGDVHDPPVRLGRRTGGS